MKIVIDIDDEDYKRIQDIPDVFNSLTSRMYSAIKNGTPLPKGHGRLIDADAFIAKMEDASKRQQYKKLLIDDYLTVDDVFKAIIESLQNKGLANGDAATIIEADKAESWDDCSDLCKMTADVPDFESERYVEKRVENYTKMLKSGILDCVKDDTGIHENVDECGE